MPYPRDLVAHARDALLLGQDFGGAGVDVPHGGGHGDQVPLRRRHAAVQPRRDGGQ